MRVDWSEEEEEEEGNLLCRQIDMKIGKYERDFMNWKLIERDYSYCGGVRINLVSWVAVW